MGAVPISASRRLDLAVPASYAFSFLADPSTATVIDPAVREYRPDGPLAVGTGITVRLRAWGVPIRARSVVRMWEPGACMVMESVRPAHPVQVRATHRFEPLADDRCAYVWTLECTPTVPLGALAARAFVDHLAANAVVQQARFQAEVQRRWEAGRRTG